MQNNIPTLYILELDSSVVKSAEISTILCPFAPKIKKKHWWYCHGEHDASKMSLRSMLIKSAMLRVKTMFRNKGEGLLQACISSIHTKSYLERKKTKDIVKNRSV